MTDIPRIYPKSPTIETMPEPETPRPDISPVTEQVDTEEPGSHLDTKEKPDRKGMGGPSSEAGKETSSANLTKHGFYSNKFLPCRMCRYNKESKLWNKEGDCKELADLDIFGIKRCSLERKRFDELVKDYFANYKLVLDNKPIVEKMVMIQIRLGRLEAYLADEGLTQAVPVFNPKTGDTHWLNAQNVLKKDAYYDDKSLRTWLESLQILKKTEENHKLDIALKFTD